LKPLQALEARRERALALVRKHRVRNARLFGLDRHGGDNDRSDLDLLVDPTEKTTLFDIAALRVELSDLLGVRVDVITPKALPERYRDAVLAEAKPI
jgi:predicted nucleotidyltransferase